MSEAIHLGLCANKYLEHNYEKEELKNNCVKFTCTQCGQSCTISKKYLKKTFKPNLYMNLELKALIKGSVNYQITGLKVEVEELQEKIKNAMFPSNEANQKRKEAVRLKKELISRLEKDALPAIENSPLDDEE